MSNVHLAVQFFAQIAVVLAVVRPVLARAAPSSCAPCWARAWHAGSRPGRPASRTARPSGIGVLMNARGLMDLIIINIGLERGIISEGLFAALVLMAVATTLMASPIFDWLVGEAAPGAAERRPARRDRSMPRAG